MNPLGKKGMSGQDRHRPIEQPLQSTGRNGLDVNGDGIRAVGTADRGGLGIVMGLGRVTVGFGNRFFPPLAQVPSRTCLPLKPTNRMRGWE